MTEIYTRYYDDPAPLLGRHVVHDSRSKLYRFDVSSVDALVSVRHTRNIPVLDQGELGSCTGNASAGALGSDPYYEGLPAGTNLDEDEAVKIYSLATTLDSYKKNYPPNDTGSDGLSAAKACQQLGFISGYTHTFSYDDALKAITLTPVIIGIDWYNNFFTPDKNGVVSIGKNDYVAGGHEIVVDEIDVENSRIGLTNSWGTSWGVNGRFYIPFALFKQLLAKDGDVTIFTPLNAPAPTPTPVPPSPSPTPAPVEDADKDLELAFETYQVAVANWKAAKGL